MSTAGASGHSSRRRVVRRWLTRIVVFLLLGAVVNVAVAWGFVLFLETDLQDFRGSIHDRYEGSHELDDGYVNYDAHRWKTTNGLRVVVQRLSMKIASTEPNTCSFEKIVPRWSRDFLDIPEMSGREYDWLDVWYTHYAIVEARGWPFLSLWGAVKKPWPGRIRKRDGTALHFSPKHYYAIELNSAPSGDDVRFLPLRPLLSGFVANTLFYAVILWLLVAAPFALRRRRRARKGLCPKCAYPNGQSAVCTECGAALESM